MTKNLIRTLGIDCSHWQNDKSTPQKMDFKKAVAAGAAFAFIKVSERGGIDVDYEYNWKTAKEAGIPRGGYHFLRWDLPAITQARVFCAAIQDDPGELPPVADFEAPERDGKFPSNSMLLAFLEEVENILHRRPIIYTSAGFWRSHGNNKITRVSEQFWRIYPLWVANYGVSSPLVPAPWKDWLFWQFTATGNGPMYGAESKGIDLNWFNGDLIALQQLIDKTTGTSTVQPPAPPAVDLPVVTPPADESNLQGQINILAQHVGNIETYLGGFKLP